MSDDKCRWKSEDYEVTCSEPILPDDPNSYCILHSENDDKDLDAFTAKVEVRLKGTKTEDGEEEIDLRGCYFPENFQDDYFVNYTFDNLVHFTEATFSQKATFRSATFSRMADFDGATFSQKASFTFATFSQEVCFCEATFSQEAYFFDATFSKADFTGASFTQNADFSDATFSEEADFSEAEFSEVVDFYKAEFSKVDFSRTSFSQASFYRVIFSQANFSYAIFSQKVDFFSLFSQEADFSYAKFSKADFHGTVFGKGADFSWAEFEDRVSFLPFDKNKVIFGASTSFKYTRFMGDVIFQDVDLSQCSFRHSSIDKVDFRYCTFGEKKNHFFRIIRVFLIRPIMKESLGKEGRLFRVIRTFSRYIWEVSRGKFRRQNVLRDELDCDKMVAKEKDDREEYEPVRRVYLELKRNLEEKKDWNAAGDFHFGEMECRRQMKDNRFKRYFFSLEAIYWLASGYGERPLRAFLILMGFIFILFPLLYLPSEGWDYFKSLWDSICVGTLMRLDNPIKGNHDWGKRGVAIFEIIIVPLQIALLALALRRKVKR